MNDKVEKIKSKYYPPIPSFPLYGLIVCGIMLILIGVYLQINNIEFIGETGGESYGVNGPTSIVFGIVVLIFPIYTLVKQNREKKKYDKNLF